MPETEPQMLARLKELTRPRVTVEAWVHELSPDDLNAIRWLLATMERYRAALKERMPKPLPERPDRTERSITWDQGYNTCANCVEMVVRAALAPAPSAPEDARLHILSCDEYHLHHAPECCRSTCWCLMGVAPAPAETEVPR